MNDAPEVETPMSTIVAAGEGKAKFYERLDDGYVALEESRMRESGRNNTRFLARQANADASMKAAVPVASRSNASRLNTPAIAAAGLRNSSQLQARMGAQEIMDKKRLMVTNTGGGKASNTADILGTTSALATRRSIEDAQNEIMVDNARTQAAFDVAKAGVQAYAMGDPRKEGSAFADYWKQKTAVYDDNGVYAGSAPLEDATFRDRLQFGFRM